MWASQLNTQLRMSEVSMQGPVVQLGVGLGAVLLGSFLRTVGVVNKQDAKVAQHSQL